MKYQLYLWDVVAKLTAWTEKQLKKTFLGWNSSGILSCSLYQPLVQVSTLLSLPLLHQWDFEYWLFWEQPLQVNVLSWAWRVESLPFLLGLWGLVLVPLRQIAALQVSLRFPLFSWVCLCPSHPHWPLLVKTNYVSLCVWHFPRGTSNWHNRSSEMAVCFSELLRVVVAERTGQATLAGTLSAGTGAALVDCWSSGLCMSSTDSIRYNRVQGFVYLSLYNTGLYNEMHALVHSCYTQQNHNKKQWNLVKWRGLIEKSIPEERSYSGVWWYDCGYFCITCQMAAGWTGCCRGGYFLLVSSGLCVGPSPYRYHWYLVGKYQWCSGRYEMTMTGALWCWFPGT